MGSEMAFNLFSKRFAEASDSHFVVCDAVPDASKAFSENFLAQFPGAKISVATTPEEYVESIVCLSTRRQCIVAGPSWHRRPL